MILFVNFAPLHFGGGAEKWMIDVASEIKKSEDVCLVDTHVSIANIYGKLVLKRNFDKRIEIDNTNSFQHKSLTISDFILFTKQWRKIRNIFSKSRRIYIRYELLETFIVFYFGGWSSFNKTVSGIHSPFIYWKPLSILDHIHNIVYASFFSKWILSKMYKIHVLNEKDRKFFEEEFDLSNIVKIPNYISLPIEIKKRTNKNENKKLHILFVGELNMRKGVDILINLIKMKNIEFIFHIAGDGPLKNDIKSLLKAPNMQYYGHLKKEKLINLYINSDVLFMPSRAESFSLVCLEAMSYGLPIITSPQIDLDLPSYIHKINKEDTPEGYLQIFEQTINSKLTVQDKNKIESYVKKNYSRNLVMNSLKDHFFN